MVNAASRWYRTPSPCCTSQHSTISLRCCRCSWIGDATRFCVTACVQGWSCQPVLPGPLTQARVCTCVRTQYGQTAHDISVEAGHVGCIRVLESSLKTLAETAQKFSAILENHRAAVRKQNLLIEMGACLSVCAVRRRCLTSLAPPLCACSKDERYRRLEAGDCTLQAAHRARSAPAQGCGRAWCRTTHASPCCCE